MTTRRFRAILPGLTLALGLTAALVLPSSAVAEDTLRIAMTAADIPTTTGMPNNGWEGMRFLG
ncbi:MAG: transporter substrate-binding protein, partial [Herbaspirillum sp.]|nr:transporter substrate-binding protein [Herbaspirillum sp.]